jgi:hypothetical protein
MRAVASHPDVSDPFVYFNDDFYVLRPVDGPPACHRGPLEALLGPEKARRRLGGSSYRGGRRDTARLLAELGIEDPLAYDALHLPMVFGKAKLAEALELGSGVPALHYRTLYGNLAGRPGIQHANVKISDRATVPKAEWDFVSTNTRAFEGGRVGVIIRDLFPDPSPYEDPSYEPDQPRDLRRARRDRLRRRQPRDRRRAGARVPQ